MMGNTQYFTGRTARRARPGPGVQDKKDERVMAKTTRKTDPKTAGIKPATRRAKAAAPAGAGETATARRRTKVAAAAASASEPADQGFVPEPSHDEIALRAWKIYQDRGASHGDANRDWLEARAQLFAERGLKP
jgi:hypothetical protein